MARSQKVLTLEQRVASYISDHNLTYANRPLLVAVSGGPDSVCLLHILYRFRTELGLELHAAHLDHQLREESAADAQYVLDLCHRLGVPVTIAQADVTAYMGKNNLSLEEAAREVRYGFLADTAKSIGAKVAAVAHTRDDHVETVLMHILRGAGTRGLVGLQAVSRWRLRNKHVVVIRPMLEVTREETNVYCHRHRLHPRSDPTNLDKKQVRNRVRLELIPVLKEYNPAILQALLRTSQIALDDIDFIEQSAEKHLKKLSWKKGDTLALDRSGLLALHPSLQRAVLRQSIEQITGTLKDIEARHVEEMMSLVLKPAGKRISLPYGLFFTAEYDCFLLGRAPGASSPFPTLSGEYALHIPGIMEIPGWRIHTDNLKNRVIEARDSFTAYFDQDRIRGQIIIRARKPGDRFQPFGLGEEKKVGRFMLDAHIPYAWRGSVPLVCAGKQVLWLVGYRIDERFKVTENTERVLKISFESITDG